MLSCNKCITKTARKRFRNGIRLLKTFPKGFLTWQIIDPLGKVVLQKTTAATADITLPEVASLPNGFYFLRLVDTEKRQAVLKIIKQ